MNRLFYSKVFKIILILAFIVSAQIDQPAQLDELMPMKPDVKIGHLTVDGYTAEAYFKYCRENPDTIPSNDCNYPHVSVVRAKYILDRLSPEQIIKSYNVISTFRSDFDFSLHFIVAREPKASDYIEWRYEL